MNRSLSIAVVAGCIFASHLFGQSAEDWYAKGREALSKNDYDRAVASFDEAIWLNSKYAAAYNNRGYAYDMKGYFQNAIADYIEAIRSDGTYHYSYNNLAWLKATCPDAAYRDGNGAVPLAARACELTAWGIPDYIATLAAAYAASGNFEKAMEWQEKIIASSTDQPFRAKMRERLLLYTGRKPFVSPPR